VSWPLSRFDRVHAGAHMRTTQTGCKNVAGGSCSDLQGLY
jgi:hypothetical protein